MGKCPANADTDVPCGCGVCVIDGPVTQMEQRIAALEATVLEMRRDLVEQEAQILSLATRLEQLSALLVARPERYQ